ncbi:MAG: hypothetical protein IIX16_03185 [Clostridia bacterium]|nr:hypothetical protein [Clostridia bacterium]
MKCNNCGRELQDGMTICSCGATVAASAVGKDDGKKKKTISIIVGVVCLIVAAVLILGDVFEATDKVGSEESEYIEMVQEGSLYFFPDETVEDAFGDFFADPEWKSFVSEDGDRIVEFNGTCTYDYEDANCCIQFTVDEKTGEFEITYLDIAEDTFSGVDINEVLEIIFSE